MTTATKTKPAKLTRAKLEAERDRLGLRRLELEALIEQSSEAAELSAIEDAYRNGAPASGGKATRLRRVAAENELLVVDRELAVVGRLLDEIIAEEARAEQARRFAELERYAEAERAAYERWGEAFASLWGPYQELRGAIETLHSQWAGLVAGDVCQLHQLDPIPGSFARLVSESVIALTLGTEFASHSPLSKFVQFIGRDATLALGKGTDVV